MPHWIHLFLFMMISPLFAYSPPKILSLEEAFRLDLLSEKNDIRAIWHIASECYLYQDKLQITLFTSQNQRLPLLKEELLPQAITLEDPTFGSQRVYRNQLALRVPLDLSSSSPRFLQVDYQGCADSGYCYPPTTQWFEVTFAQDRLSIQPIDHPPLLSQRSKEKLTISATSLITFYFFGILLAFTPCILPMIPILGAIIMGARKLSTSKAFGLSLSYVLSMAFTYAIAGIVAALLGKNLQAFLQKPGVILSFAALFIYLGLVQLGIGHITLPQSWQTRVSQWQSKQSGGTYIGAIIMGILATLIASPCVTPPLITALSYISQTGNVLLGGSALFILGLGIGTPLLIVGTVGGKYLPKSGPWMLWVSKCFAILMFALSLWLIDRIYPFRTLLPGHHHNETQYFQIIHTRDELIKLQNTAIKMGKPLLLDFYADWCVSCRHLEQTIFTDPHVQSQLTDWILIRADITAYDRENQALLKKFDLLGPPAILFFDKKGIELTNYRVIGEITSAEFSGQLEEIP